MDPNRSTPSRLIGRIAGRMALIGLACLWLASPAWAITFVSSTPIAGDSVLVTVTVEDVPDGDAVDVVVSIPDGAGDLLGLFGNADPESLVAALSVADPSGTVTQSQFASDRVWKVGGGNVMSPVKRWDWGLRFGAAGSAGGPITRAAFRLAGPGLTAASLTGAFNQGWRFGVRIQSTSGAEGSAKIGVAATTPPQGVAPGVAIVSPMDGTLLASSDVAVVGSVSGTAPVSVVVNGVPAAVDGVGFAATLVLQDGPHTLTATADNAFGSAGDAVAITIDTTPPLVTITAPVPGTLTAAASVTVVGTVVDASPIASLTVNGTPASLVGDSFSAELALPLGDTAISVVATDAAGHTGSATTTITRGTPPAITITQPADGFETTEASALVAGSVSGTPPLVVVVNGIAASVAGESFQAVVPLAEGENTLTASATGALGSAADTVTGTRVGGPPMPALAISITAPPDRAFVSSSRIPVSGVVSDPSAEVSVNGTNAVVAGTQYLAAAVPLAHGENTLVATARRGDETATAQVTVTFDEPPQIVITSPRDGSTLRVAETDVEGLVDDVAAHVDVNGIAASVGPGGRFVARGVPLEPGANLLLARAIDVFGAAGTDRAEVTRADDSAGRLRLVLVVPERLRRGADSGDPDAFAPLVAEDGEEFAAALSAIGFPAALYTPSVEAPAIGSNTFFAYLFVFTEAGRIGEPVEIPGLGDEFPVFSDSAPLRPISELAEEISGLADTPGAAAELVPSDFAPNGFVLFTLQLGGGGGLPI